MYKFSLRQYVYILLFIIRTLSFTTIAGRTKSGFPGIPGYGVTVSRRWMERYKPEIEEHATDLFCGQCDHSVSCRVPNCGKFLIIPNCIVMNMIDQIVMGKEQATVNFKQGLNMGPINRDSGIKSLSSVTQSGMNRHQHSDR